MNKNIKALLITASVALLPVILWLIANKDYVASDNYLLTISKLFALAGFGLYGWSIMLSSRASIFVKLYGGLLSLYRWHHRIGISALILLIIHPTAVMLRYLEISFESFLNYIRPTLDLPKIAGMIALSVLFLGVVASIFIKLKHETFVKLHAAMGIFFFLAAYHAFLMPTSDIGDSIILTTYATFWILASAFVVIYRSLLRRSFNPSYEYIVQNIANFKDYLKLTIRPKKDFISPLPGQFVFVKPIKGKVPNESHPFSVVSSYKSGSLSFLIKNDGDFTGKMNLLKSGDSIEVDGPWGEFASELENEANQIWIAGGIGITPFISMASNLKYQQVSLYYSIRSKDHAYLVPELKNIALKNKNFKLNLIDTSIDNLLTIDDLKKDNKFSSSAFWICGPPKMITHFKKELKKCGVKSSKIHTEEFKLS